MTRIRMTRPLPLCPALPGSPIRTRVTPASDTTTADPLTPHLETT